MTKLEDLREDPESESSRSGDSQSAVNSADLDGEDSEVDTDKWPPNRLFIGVIDINKCEEDARALYKKLLEEGDGFSTEFWRGVRPAKEWPSSINLPVTDEELKEAEKVYDDVCRALEQYNEFMPRNQYFKPHTASAKKFLRNAEFINRQLSLYSTTKEWISSFLGIGNKEFTKMLRYYSKPRESSIKNFKEKQADKARFDSEIAEELKKFMKVKARQWI